MSQKRKREKRKRNFDKEKLVVLDERRIRSTGKKVERHFVGVIRAIVDLLTKTSKENRSEASQPREGSGRPKAH